MNRRTFALVGAYMLGLGGISAFVFTDVSPLIGAILTFNGFIVGATTEHYSDD